MTERQIFWCVWNPARQSPTFKHVTEESAITEAEKDARMMAAAPDMLKALQDIVEEFGNSKPNKVRMADIAQAAIAKATV